MFIEHTSLSVEGVFKYYEPKSFFGLLETVSPHLFGMSLVIFILTHFYVVIEGINQKRDWIFGLFGLMLIANLSGFFIGGWFFSLIKLVSTILMVCVSVYLMIKIRKF